MDSNNLAKASSRVRIMRIARLSLAAMAFLLAAPGLAIADSAKFDIEAQPLPQALRLFAVQAHMQLLYEYEAVAHARGNAVRGEIDKHAALEQLLKDSGLEPIYSADNVATIRGSGVKGAPHSQTEGETTPTAGRSLRLARADQPESEILATNGFALSGQPEGLSEIVVTAQKRLEKLQDVPVEVSVLNPDELVDRNANRLQDYFMEVPGLSINTHPQGTQDISIRGIYSGQGFNPTAGITIDDVPYGSSTLYGLSNYPDVDPSDLAQIEVLKGPQGTLYGASSIGGLIKYVTKDPSTSGISGRVQLLGNDVEHGDLGYGFRGSINLPLSDNVAIRASAFTRRDPGYITNVTTGQSDVNRVDVSGGRAALLWNISDALKVKFSALIQHTQGDGQADVDVNDSLQPVYGGLTQARMRGTGEYQLDVRLYTATLTAKLGSLDLTSITGYGINKSNPLLDSTTAYGSCALNGCGAPGFSGYGVSGASFQNSTKTDKFTQEFRVTSPQGQKLEWLAGLYYTHESTPDNQTVLAVDPSTGTPAGLLIDFDFPTTLAERAVFGDVTWHFTEQFDVQLGGRYSQSQQVYNETDTGPLTEYFFGFPSPNVNPSEHADGHAFTYLLTPQFKFSSDLMAYARFASGYRLGGFNANAVQEGIPVRFIPDKNYDYEVGVKGDFLNQLFSYDVSLYYVDWSRLQISLIYPGNGFPYGGNAGKSKSEGAEMTVKAHPAAGLTLTAVGSLIDAELTQDLPASTNAYGLAGARLPFSSRFSGTLSAEQDVRLPAGVTGFFGASFSYIGAREGYFTHDPTDVRERFPSYTDLNLRIGARYQTWTANLFANNVTDQRGITGIDQPGQAGPANNPATQTVLYSQPRMIGLSFAKTF